MRVSIRILALGAAVGVAIGCGSGGGGASAPSSSPTVDTTPAASSYTPPNVLAGLPVDPSPDQKPYQKLVAMSGRFGHRGDPFQLTAEEAAYDKQQNVERVLGTMGGFTTEYETPPEETKEIPPEEPQPYRRLAGIVVGDSVLAIIDMGDGHAATIIRPGMKIPNTEWTVVSINEDQAVLHRDGPIGPHTVTVRLESPPPGMGGESGGFPGNGANGGPPSGAPNLPPGAGNRSRKPGVGRG